MGCAALSASLSSSSNCFFSLSGIVLSALTSSISFLIALCGSVNALVSGSIAAITMEILAATASYSTKFLKPYFLVTASSSASYLGFALREAAHCIFSTTTDMSFWAAMKPSTCFSVSLIWPIVDCAQTVAEHAATAAVTTAAMVARIVWGIPHPQRLLIGVDASALP